MKKVMVYAYTQFNLGDDLFIKVLSERYPETTFMLYAPKAYKRIFKSHPNIRIVASNNIIFKGLNFIFRRFHVYSFTRRLVAKSCDMSIQIGGSLFIQGENWREELQHNQTMKIPNKPFFLLGANFGPFTNHQFYSEYKTLFRTYTDICFREKYSYDLFSDLSQVRIADDLVFQLKKPAITSQKTLILSVIKPSLRKHLAGYDAIYYRKMADIAIYFMERGYHVTLMGFCQIEQDDEAVEMIRQQIPQAYAHRMTTYIYTTNIDEAVQHIAESAFVVASRFHAMILGWITGKGVFPIVYSSKMANVMHDVGFNGAHTNFDTIQTLAAEDVFASIRTNAIDVTQRVQNKKSHFDVLDRYLKKSDPRANLS
ncbi:polysaccharide pyruvyl transferase family protein [Lentibacillus sp. N15]|uniref:polysaccharide pyruvyl transferase family protein n=1 Tax=Lentibacillus songyuanensis TaxID=3136161 RepID=UPI0031B9FA6B